MRPLLLSCALAVPATALLVCAPPLSSEAAHLVGADGLAAALASVGAADAAWIRRGKMKKRNSGDPVDYDNWGGGFRLGEDPTGTTMATSVELVDEGLFVPTSGGAASDARVLFDGVVTPGAGPYVVTLEYLGVPLEVSVDGLAFAKGKAAMVMTDLGVIVRLNATDSDGSVRVVLSNDDPGWDPMQLGAVSLSDGFGEVALADRVTDMTYSTQLDWTGLPSAEALDGGRILVTSTLFGPTGTVLDSQVEMDTIGAAAAPMGIEKLRVSATNSGNAKATFFTRADANEAMNSAGANMSAVVTDNETGAALLDKTLTSPNAVERQFIFQNLDFSEPDLAVGDFISTVVDFFDDSGTLLGASEVVAAIGDIGSSTWTPFEAQINGVGIAASISIRRLDAVKFEVAIAVLSDVPTVINLAFGDYMDFEPTPTDIYMTLTAEWRKWVAKGNAGIGSLDAGGSATVQVTLFDEAGVARDIEGGGLDEVPELMFGFGKGTKNSATQTSAKPQLL